MYARRAISGGWPEEVNTRAASSNRLTNQAKAASQAAGVTKEPAVSNVIPFRARTPRIEPAITTPIPLYRLSVTRAKALGMCPAPANDTRTRRSRATRREATAEDRLNDDELPALLERSIRNLGHTPAIAPQAPLPAIR